MSVKEFSFEVWEEFALCSFDTIRVDPARHIMIPTAYLVFFLKDEVAQD